MVLRSGEGLRDGCPCAVIALSLIPRKPVERIKTDRWDARKLLALFKAGMLTEVFAPDEQQEAARELTRLRESSSGDKQKKGPICKTGNK